MTRSPAALLKVGFVIVWAGSNGFAAQMKVSLCNLGQFPAPVLTRAKAETESVFQSAGVQIEWRACDEGPNGSTRSAWFTLRLRSDRPPDTAGAASLDAMGRAFLSRDGWGNLADVYAEAVSALAERHQSDPGALLGHVIAHELGHLLLGPGHVPDGVMHGAWNATQLKALRQRGLKFGPSERGRIVEQLQARYRR
jgi:hypothetical protein